MHAYFEELGRTVLTRWKANNFALSAFPEIARSSLEERPPAGNLDVEALIRDFLLNDAQPAQSTSGFGQPEIIVYEDPRFYIQVLYWLDGTTDIHQHEFSGAFHVLRGSSIHAHFEFDDSREVTAHFRVGKIRMKDIHLLETGSTVPIVSGRECIHSLFHLDTPSISVVIRTHHDPGTGPQFTYLPPRVAIDPVYHDGLTIRRNQLLDVLERTDDSSFAKLVREMIGELDFTRGFFVLQNSMGHLRRLAKWDAALELFEKKHGALAEGVGETLDEIVRRDSIAAFRATVEDVEHRFFLALLLNVDRREDLLSLVAQRFADAPPNETILRWTMELIDASEFGTSILDAQFPASLDIPVEDQPDVFLESLRIFMEGDPKSEFGSPDQAEAFRNAFAQSSLRILVG